LRRKKKKKKKLHKRVRREGERTQGEGPQNGGGEEKKIKKGGSWRQNGGKRNEFECSLGGGKTGDLTNSRRPGGNRVSKLHQRCKGVNKWRPKKESSQEDKDSKKNSPRSCKGKRVNECSKKVMERGRIKKWGTFRGVCVNVRGGKVGDEKEDQNKHI